MKRKILVGPDQGRIDREKGRSKVRVRLEEFRSKASETVVRSAEPQPMRNCDRKAFSLLELLVVLSIIAVLSAMLVLLWPKRQIEAECATNLQGWLVECRSLALRNQRPTGLKVLNGNPQQIEQPDVWVQPWACSFTNDGTTVTIKGTDFTGADLQPGDFFEKGAGTGEAVPITSVTPTTLQGTLMAGSYAPYWTGWSYDDWRIVRQPRALLGAPMLPWPTVVTLTPDDTVLFDKSGVLIGRTQPTRWTVGGKLVVQVNVAGQVSIYPVAPGADPYLFGRDGKSSGF